jgi:hypothetical protein
MRWQKIILLSVALACLAHTKANIRDTTRLDRLISIPNSLLEAADKKARQFTSSLDKQMSRYLARLEKREQKLKRQLMQKDSALAESLFGDIKAKYSGLKNIEGTENKFSSVYSGRLDSLNTALEFVGSGNLRVASNANLEKTISSYKALQLKLNASEQIKKQLLERQRMLKRKLEELGMTKELNKFKKELFYYQQQIREFKEAFESPSKLEAKLMELVMKVPSFREFFAKNSLLGSLFALPGSSSTSSSSLNGFQTRASIQQNLLDRFGSGINIANVAQRQTSSAIGQPARLTDAREYIPRNAGANDADMPKHYNTQRTKSLFQRLEISVNIQSQKARYFFPVTSDISLHAGYKANDRITFGTGVGYRLGWGVGWNNIAISHQGVSLRSFLDYKISRSFYFASGYEMNYRSMIRSIQQLKDYSAWSASGLAGISKKYQVSKKLKGEIKVLWDFLSYQQIPRTNPILIRFGYVLK